ncbi:MAG: CBS domain-containing protein, partial [Mixta calida]|nr:CBS domain-containing protein [Mixta calida]
GYAGAAARRGEWLDAAPVPEDMSLREALSLFIARQTDKLPVADAQGAPLGVLHFSDLLRQREGT